ncbi:acyl-CoA dehydrogenase family protein [Nonomuraea sp. NPDC048826]|uniref:acyl-CoA dehydrogenase family protein n=1 Tax=Nonomuraea sp. NPDC048826 TaxID=3364347 RepID=UPI003721FD09
MGGDALGVQLALVPEDYGGVGGGAFDSYRICERLARLDLGSATSVFATFLGSDPILFRRYGGELAHGVGRVPYRRNLLRVGGVVQRPAAEQPDGRAGQLPGVPAGERARRRMPVP